MKRVTAINLIVVAFLLFTTGCSSQEDATSLAKRDLAAAAKELNIEISQVEATAKEIELGSAAKAEGYQAGVDVLLKLAWKCPRYPDWLDGQITVQYFKVNNAWQNGGFPNSWYTQGYIPVIDCALKSPPRDWQEMLYNRRLIEKWNESTIENHIGGFFRRPTSPSKWLMALVGPTWMFETNWYVKPRLQDFFDREFSDQEIIEFQTNPAKAEEVIQMLEQRGVSKEVVDLHRQALTYEGRQNLLGR